MNTELIAYDQIVKVIGRHFDFMYYIDLETDEFCEVIPARNQTTGIPSQGNDFFSFVRENAPKVIHPDDLEEILRIHDKETLMELLSHSGSYSNICRLLVNGKIIHVRHLNILCEDKKHAIFCMEDIEKEYQEKEEQKKNLVSAQHFARRDGLTGVKNKNAFSEETQEIDKKIKAGAHGCRFGVVICDINDLKLINDTRGHSVGDESIQRTSNMICGIFKHSPVFRIGGDEFAVLLHGSDYVNRDSLMEQLHEENLQNKRSRSAPEIARGMTVFDPDTDHCFGDVFDRADHLMYENKNTLKAEKLVTCFREMDQIDRPIPPERKRLLDGMFDALLTVSGGGYVFVNDMRYDFSKWALSLVDDFGIESEYMYHADEIWTDYIHPDDLTVYRDAVDAVLRGDAELRSIYYRARKADGTYVMITTRGFVLNDSEGNPEYFGGIMLPQNENL